MIANKSLSISLTANMCSCGISHDFFCLPVCLFGCLLVCWFVCWLVGLFIWLFVCSCDGSTYRKGDRTAIFSFRPPQTFPVKMVQIWSSLLAFLQRANRSSGVLLLDTAFLDWDTRCWNKGRVLFETQNTNPNSVVFFPWPDTWILGCPEFVRPAKLRQRFRKCSNYLDIQNSSKFNNLDDRR